MGIVAGGSAMLDLMVLSFWPAVPMNISGCLLVYVK
jgi:hypothetical protein